MSTDTDLSGELLDGRFRVESPVGRGRFGAVFHGRDQTRGLACAIRVFEPPGGNGGGAFRSEAAVDAFRLALRECVLRGHRLGQRSEHIAKTFGFAIPPGFARDAAPAPKGAPMAPVAYVASGWLGGETLAESFARRRVDRLGGRTIAEAVATLDPVARALGILHDLGGVHGAVHPHAIRLVDLGRTQQTRLLDAGLDTVLASAAGASMLDAGHASRHPAWHPETDVYQAPELLSPALGEPSARTDVYALALLVLEVLADRPPVPLGGERETRERVLDPLGRPTPGLLSIVVDPVVADVLARAVSLEPLARFRDVTTFWDTLKAAVERDALVVRKLAPGLVGSANDTIQMSGVALPSVRSLDALIEAVAVEPPPRESEPETDLPLELRGYAEVPFDASEPPARTATSASTRAAAVHVPAPGLILPGQVPLPPLSVVPPRWSPPDTDGGSRRRRSRVPLFLGLGIGAAIGIAVFVHLLSRGMPGSFGAVGAPPPGSPSSSALLADGGTSRSTSTSASPAAPSFDVRAAEQSLAELDARLVNCRSAVGPSGKGALHVTFATDGTVGAVGVDPPYAGTSRGACLVGLFRTPRIAAFSGTADPISHPFSL